MMKSSGRRVRHAWRNRTLRTKGLIVVASPLAALLFIAPLLFFSQREDSRTRGLVTHTLLVRGQIEDIMTLHLEASSRFRGFLLTGSSLYLKPLDTAVVQLLDSIDRLDGLISHSPAQVARVAELRPLTEEFLSTQDWMSSAYEPGTLLSATEQGNILRGTAILDEMEVLLDEMRAEEDRLLSIQKAAVRNAGTRMKASLWIGIPLGLFLSVIVTLLFTRGVARRIALLERNSRRLAKGERLVPLPEAGDEIGRLGTALEEAGGLLRDHEAAVRDANVFLDSIVENIPNMIFVKDAKDLRFVRFNKAGEELLGHTREALLGKNDYDVFSEEEADIFTSKDRQTLESKALLDIPEEGVVTASGETRLLHTKKIPILDKEGNPRFLLGISEDITEHKRVEEEVRQAKDEAERANLVKSEFLSRMSHELRTPLNAILGFGQLLEMDRLPPEQQDSVVQILKAGRHLLDLINEVLDISRIEAGGLTLPSESVRIADALSDALDLIRPLADARSIGISIDNRVDGHHVRADRQRLKQVLLNLLSNAVKYNAEGGHVTLSCTEAEDGLMRIGVADTGSGIAPEEMERVFSPFDRLDRQEGDVEGTGLGLALSRGLMEAMGGRLDVESVLGEGSTFTIELPLAQSPLALLEADPAETPPEAPSPLDGQHTLLYIEDNLSNLKLIERVLERRPQVRLMSSIHGTLGIELARHHLPGLILLDLHLPDIGGEEVLRRLRADPLTRGIPVVIVSADAVPSQVRRLLDAGASDYLTKPLDMTRFLEVIDAILGAGKGRPRPGEQQTFL